jgi:ATP-dependent Clp protease ATP-binding subunit ClpB
MANLNVGDAAHGARPLRRLLQRRVEDVLAERVLAGEFSPGDLIRVDVEGDDLTFSREVPSEPVPAPVAA